MLGAAALRLRPPVLLVVFALLLLKAGVVTSKLGLDLSPTCTKYRPEDCALVRPRGQSQPLTCHRGDGRIATCEFDVSELQNCPLPESGRLFQIWHQDLQQQLHYAFAQPQNIIWLALSQLIPALLTLMRIPFNPSTRATLAKETGQGVQNRQIGGGLRQNHAQGRLLWTNKL